MKYTLFEVIKCGLLAGILAVLALASLQLDQISRHGINVSSVGGKQIGGDGEIPVAIADTVDVKNKGWQLLHVAITQ